jgi:transposase-like protein
MNTPDTQTTDDTPAGKCIAAFGGVRALARELGRNPSSISRWRSPKEEGGTGGSVPAQLQGRVLALARARGLSLVAEDLILKAAEHGL